MDHSSAHGSGGAFRGGSGGGGSSKGSGSGIGGDSSSTIGGGGASADAWTRLASSGVEDDLTCAVGCGGGGWPGSGPGGMPYGHFLDACFLCRKPIASNRDIFMYRGDIPFCSEECRREQMEADEEMERKEKSTTKKLSARPAASLGGDVESPPRPPETRAGSILAG